MPLIQIKPTSPRLYCRRVNSTVLSVVCENYFILYGPLEITGGGSTRREARICLKCVVIKEDHINQMQWKQSDLQ